MNMISIIENGKKELQNLIEYIDTNYTNFKDFEILGMSLDTIGELATDTIGAIKFIGNVYGKYQESTFKRFLKGVSVEFYEKGNFTKNDKKYLETYLSKENNVEFISTTIRKSLTANSLKCTEVLAIIVGQIIRNQLEMNVINITIIDALTNLNDIDLENFIEIYDCIIKENNENRRINLSILYKHLDKVTIELSLNKLINLQIVQNKNRAQYFTYNTISTEEIIEDSDIFLILNPASDLLYSLLQINS